MELSELRSDLAPSLARLADCRGACLPAPAGSAIDLVYAHSVAGLRHPALTAIQAAFDESSGWTRAYLEQLYDAVVELPIHDFISAFRPAVSFLHLHPGVCQRDPLTTALSLIRFILGITPTTLVIPERAFAPDGLYLPHLGVVLSAGYGPIAADGHETGVRFTWSDGMAIDVPTASQGPLAFTEDYRLQALEVAAGWPILNRVADAHDAILMLAPPPARIPLEDDLAVLDAAHELLREVWPESYAATRRYLHSAILQPVQPDHSTSVTLDALQGTFIASCRDAVQVADAMVHEGSHARLALLLRIDALIDDDGAEIHDSPWRHDKRPLKGLLNGIHAFVNVAMFYRRLANSDPQVADYASHIYDEQRTKVKQAWTTLLPLAKPTELGEHLLLDLGTAVESL
jgi:hypothetical protein